MWQLLRDSINKSSVNPRLTGPPAALSSESNLWTVQQSSRTWLGRETTCPPPGRSSWVDQGSTRVCLVATPLPGRSCMWDTLSIQSTDGSADTKGQPPRDRRGTPSPKGTSSHLLGPFSLRPSGRTEPWDAEWFPRGPGASQELRQFPGLWVARIYSDLIWADGRVCYEP